MSSIRLLIQTLNMNEGKEFFDLKKKIEIKYDDYCSVKYESLVRVISLCYNSMLLHCYSTIQRFNNEYN